MNFVQIDYYQRRIVIKSGYVEMFGAGRFSSPKQKVFKVFRLMRGSEDSALNLSQSNANEDQRHPETLNTEAYMISNQRMHELETQKAFVTALSRHERWKAGGPI